MQEIENDLKDLIIKIVIDVVTVFFLKTVISLNDSTV